MTPAQIALLVPMAVHFHQDFDIDPMTARDLFAAYARGLEAAQRQNYYDALEALLREGKDEVAFRDAFWAIGAEHAPFRNEVESFLVWSQGSEGQAEISSPGPTLHYETVQVDLSRPPN